MSDHGQGQIFLHLRHYHLRQYKLSGDNTLILERAMGLTLSKYCLSDNETQYL